MHKNTKEKQQNAPLKKFDNCSLIIKVLLDIEMLEGKKNVIVK